MWKIWINSFFVSFLASFSHHFATLFIRSGALQPWMVFEVRKVNSPLLLLLVVWPGSSRGRKKKKKWGKTAHNRKLFSERRALVSYSSACGSENWSSLSPWSDGYVWCRSVKSFYALPDQTRIDILLAGAFERRERKKPAAARSANEEQQRAQLDYHLQKI